MSITNQAAATTAPAFAHLKFAPYTYREYPKMLKNATGQDVIVNNQEEELEVLRAFEPAEEATEEVETAAEEGVATEEETFEVPRPRGRQNRR